jgi:hypothetical protein
VLNLLFLTLKTVALGNWDITSFFACPASLAWTWVVLTFPLRRMRASRLWISTNSRSRMGSERKRLRQDGRPLPRALGRLDQRRRRLAMRASS